MHVGPFDVGSGLHALGTEVQSVRWGTGGFGVFCKASSTILLLLAALQLISALPRSLPKEANALPTLEVALQGGRC
jgi:hypothetical protein